MKSHWRRSNAQNKPLQVDVDDSYNILNCIGVRMNLANFLQQIKESPVELMGVIYHNAKGVAGFRIVAEGTADQCKVNFVDIVEGMNDFRSNMITLVHNHPQGEVRPSTQDLEMTYDTIDSCKELNVTVRDHLILGGNGGIYSFAENGAL